MVVGASFVESHERQVKAGRESRKCSVRSLVFARLGWALVRIVCTVGGKPS